MMASLQRLALLSLAVLLIGVVAACGDGDSDSEPAATATSSGGDGQTPPPAAGEPFTIDVVMPFSGAVGEFGPRTLSGIELALELEYGDSINGRPIRFAEHDNLCTPEGATNAVNAILDTSTLIAGMTCSGATLAVIPLTEQEGIPQVDISLADSSTALGSDYFFQVSVPTSAVVRGVMDYIANEGYESVAVFLDETGYSQDARAPAEKYAAEHGLDVNFYEYKRGDTDFSAIVSRAAADNPDTFFQYAYAVEGGLIAKTIDQAGYDQPFFCGTVCINVEFLDSAGAAAAEGAVFGTAMLPDNPDPAVEEFVNIWRERTGEDPNDQVVLGYSLGIVALDALERAGTDWTRESIAEALRATDIDTPIGHIKFGEGGTPLDITPTMGIIKDGKPTFLATVDID